MKNYEVKIQEENNLCLCSSLQTILRRHKIYYSQREIARCLTPSEKGYFADDERIKNFLIKNKIKYDYFPYNATPFNESDMLLSEMNEYDGIIGINNHVYILDEFKDPSLKIIDPKDAKTIDRDIYSILSEMHKEFGFFGLLKYIH